MWLRQQGIRAESQVPAWNLSWLNCPQAQGIREYLGIRTYLLQKFQRRKPAPDIYLMVAETLQMKPEECLVFEDVPMGILAGKNAGIRVCAVENTLACGGGKKRKRTCAVIM